MESNDREPLLGTSDGHKHEGWNWKAPFRWFWRSGTTLGFTFAFLFSVALAMTKWVQGVYISIPYFICTLSVAEFGSGLVIAWLTGSFPLLGKRENIPWLILVGLIYGGFVTLIYVPLALIPAVDDIALLYTNPIIASIIGIVVYRDRFGVFLLIGLVFYSLGVLLVAKPEFIFGASDIVWTNRRKLGYILGGVSGVLEGITLNLVRGLRDRVPPATLPLWAYMAQFLYCFPFLFIFPVSPSHEPVKWVAFLPILVAGIFTSTAEFLLCRTCALLPAGHVGVLGSTQLMLAALWGWLIANESVGWYTIIGCVLMMLGVASVGYHTNRNLKADENGKTDVSRLSESGHQEGHRTDSSDLHQS